METTKTEKKKSPKAGRTQKMMTFRADNENVEWLNTKPNKGRYINDLIKADRENDNKK